MLSVWWRREKQLGRNIRQFRVNDFRAKPYNMKDHPFCSTELESEHLNHSGIAANCHTIGWAARQAEHNARDIHQVYDFNRGIWLVTPVVGVEKVGLWRGGG